MIFHSFAPLHKSQSFEIGREALSLHEYIGGGKCVSYRQNCGNIKYQVMRFILNEPRIRAKKTLTITGMTSETICRVLNCSKFRKLFFSQVKVEGEIQKIFIYFENYYYHEPFK